MSTVACTWPESALTDLGFMFLFSVRSEEPIAGNSSQKKNLLSREMVVSNMLGVL